MEWRGRRAHRNADGDNNLRAIVTRSGHMVRFSDKPGNETIEIVHANKKSSITITEDSVDVTTDGDLLLSAQKGTITLKAQNVKIISSEASGLEAGSTMDVKANAP